MFAHVLVQRVSHDTLTDTKWKSVLCCPRMVRLVNAGRAQKVLEVWGTTVHLRPEELDPREVWWRERYNRLKTSGYLLRFRYSPEWVPSWAVSNRDWTECEDGKRLRVCMFFLHFSTFQQLFSTAKS